MTDEALETRLRSLFHDEDSDVASTALRERVAAIADTMPVANQRSFNGRSLALLAAAALFAVALVGGAIIGASLFRVNVQTVPSPTAAAVIVLTASPLATPTATPQTSATATPPRPTNAELPTAAPEPTATPSGPTTPQIAYIRYVDKPNASPGSPVGVHCLSSETSCPETRIWLIGTDGTGAHELHPESVTAQSLYGWSPDGRYVIYDDDGTLFLSDVTGGDPVRLDTGCTDPCFADRDATFSADGQHLVFVRWYEDAFVLATMDLATGQVLELTSTRSTRESDLPTWSPDGARISFWRPGDKDFGGPITPLKSAVFVVDADGQNLVQITPAGLPAESPRWSPDGSRLVFTSTDAERTDIFTMRPDVSELHRVTTDGISHQPSWTPDGRILFAHDLGAYPDYTPNALWTMDADGGNTTEFLPASATQAFGGGLWQPSGNSSIVPPPWNPTTGTPAGPPAPTPQPTATPDLAASFSWTGSMLPSEHGNTADTATLLPDGRVLVTVACQTQAQLYDPQTGTFSATGTMIEPRGAATATLLADGRVLIAGGGGCVDGTGILASAEVYDPATGTFSTTGSMSAKRELHAAALLNDGRVLIAGGVTEPNATNGPTVVLASYIQGISAETAGGVTLASAELYDPATGTFGPTRSMADFRSQFTATVLQDGRVLVAGGGGEGYARASAEVYDPQLGSFVATGSMIKERWLHTATMLANGQVLIAGGRSPNDAPYASAEVYDPASGRFTATAPMAAPRQQHTATLLTDGRVLIAGGYANDQDSWTVLSSTEIFDPVTGKFTSTGSMGDARDGAVAVRLADGRVLIAGGTGIGPNSLFELSSAVLYQP